MNRSIPTSLKDVNGHVLKGPIHKIRRGHTFVRLNQAIQAMVYQLTLIRFFSYNVKIRIQIYKKTEEV